ncbi:MAG TPA: TlpA family protein disulfide reductase [Sedimenticola thiotaurini]|uniref:TlpA family protein disulfide reductase n=1 Tax=Sedimenticola thiotaurini TaxID=1543721 RepID=A0A831W908_9GAMM|nr:TlpA family protein disulfide reductase [Sedimenticola thiotaurini]
MKRSPPLLYLVFAVALLVAGGVGYHLYQKSRATPHWTGDGVETLPAFEFTDIDGDLRRSDEWRGRVLVVNFWATWCPPCRSEMPRFIDFQEKYGDRGLQFVAIAIDDPDLVRDFHDVYGINFPTLIGDTKAIELANRLGNRFDSLPFTAIFDRDGRTRYIQAGEISEQLLKERLLPLL